MVKDSVSLSVVTDRLKANIEVKHHKDRHFTMYKTKQSNKQNVLILFYIYKTGGTVSQWQQGWTDYIAWQIKLSLLSK